MRPYHGWSRQLLGQYRRGADDDSNDLPLKTLRGKDKRATP